MQDGGGAPRQLHARQHAPHGAQPAAPHLHRRRHHPRRCALRSEPFASNFQSVILCGSNIEALQQRRTSTGVATTPASADMCMHNLLFLLSASSSLIANAACGPLDAQGSARARSRDIAAGGAWLWPELRLLLSCRLLRTRPLPGSRCRHTPVHMFSTFQIVALCAHLGR